VGVLLGLLFGSILSPGRHPFSLNLNQLLVRAGALNFRPWGSHWHADYCGYATLAACGGAGRGHGDIAGTEAGGPGRPVHDHTPEYLKHFHAHSIAGNDGAANHKKLSEKELR